MEWIDGVKLTNKPAMDAAGQNIVDFVDIGIECTLRQLLEHGYFHAGLLLTTIRAVVLCTLALFTASHAAWMSCSIARNRGGHQNGFVLYCWVWSTRVLCRSIS